ncbi:uncharacterized protein LOC106669534 isoform X2 [Cimex lectularius]|uniref:Serpin domain-containing protein n=1 Tax=Cimex lectularius TaxID=79782 RepID=A0A8I6RXZ7_CIMLE|nr:uncharacterized protein LOC106669534 isoform X2 [Cimex lectularius]
MLTTIILFCIAGLHLTANGSPCTVDPDGSEKFNEFDWNLTKAVGASGANKNVILSPISLKLVLATLYEGAKGSSAKQLREALDLKDDKSKSTSTLKLAKIVNCLKKEYAGYDLDIGTKLFMDKGAKPRPSFQKKILNLYNATIDQVDFKNTSATITHINAWAKAVTKGHIQDLLSEADTEDSIVLLLLNAVYFKGVWENIFAANETMRGKFQVDPKTTVDVDYMRATFNLSYVESPALSASVVRLPYVGGRFAMYIILPFKKNDLHNVMSSITPDLLRAEVNKMEPITARLSLPKFKVEFASSLAPVLSKLGITDIFNSKADLSDIAESAKDLVVSNVIQKAGLEINEQGSTAYVATEAELVSKFGEYITDVDASHPFLFFIEDEATRTVVFVGRISDPTDGGRAKVAGVNQYPMVSALGVAYNPETSMSVSDRRLVFSHFDMELSRSIFDEYEGNTIVSPASIKTMLALILAGAGGKTEEEILHLLRLDSFYNTTSARKFLHDYNMDLQNPSNSITMKSGNKILVKKGLKVLETYRAKILESFGIRIEAVDFGQPGTISSYINKWVKQLTSNAISEIATESSFTPLSALAIVNVVYFKGDWRIKFDPQSNSIGCFYTNSKCVKTEFMSMTGDFRAGVIGPLNALVLELPYSDPRYTMVFVLPKIGMKQLMRDLTFIPLLPLLDSLPYVDVSIKIPKFTVDYSIKLNNILTKLGSGSMFTDKSNLTNMFATSGKVTDMVHKAKIVVNERGTIAAASTVSFVETLIASYTRHFVADRPFLYLIRMKDVGFLFQGQYMVPTGDDVKKDVEIIPPTLPQLLKGPRPQAEILSKSDSKVEDRPWVPQTSGNVISMAYPFENEQNSSGNRPKPSIVNKQY